LIRQYDMKESMTIADLNLWNNHCVCGILVIIN
jgi:hypothetical protein